MFRILFFILLSIAPLTGNPFSQSHQKNEVNIPNPLNLTPNWWDYFNVSGEQLASRVEESKKIYSASIEKLPEQDRKTAQSLIDRFFARLKTLEEFKNIPPKLTLQTPPHQKEYTYREWIALADQAYGKKELLRELESRQNLIQLSVRINTQQLDNAYAGYLANKKDPFTERLVDGLEIMINKVTIETEKLNLESFEEKIHQHKQEIENLEEEIEYSRKHINFEGITKENFQTEIETQKKKLDEINDQIITALEAKTTSLKTNGDPRQLEEATQNLIDLSVKRMGTRLNLMNLEIEKTIVTWGKDPSQIQKEINVQIQGWRELSEQMQIEIEEWKKEGDLYLDNAIKNLALAKSQRNAFSNVQYFQSQLDQIEEILFNIQEVEKNLYITEFLLTQTQMMKTKGQTSASEMFSHWWDSIVVFFQTHGKWFSKSLFKIGNVPFTPIGIFKLFIILVITFLVAKFSKKGINRFSRKHPTASSSVYVLSLFVYYFILIIGFIIAGASIGFDLSFFGWIAGGLAVWIGLSLQSIFHNFISGIIVLVSKAVRINDVITLSYGETGVVKEITLRYTLLKTFDGLHMIIPNSELVSNRFTNRTLIDRGRRVNIPFRIDLEMDKEKMKKNVIEGAKKVSITLPKPEPSVWIQRYEENFIRCELAVWVNESLATDHNISTEALYFDMIDSILKKLKTPT